MELTPIVLGHKIFVQQCPPNPAYAEDLFPLEILLGDYEVGSLCLRRMGRDVEGSVCRWPDGKGIPEIISRISFYQEERNPDPVQDVLVLLQQVVQHVFGWTLIGARD